MITSSQLVGLLGAAALLGVSQPSAFAVRSSDLAPVKARNDVVKVAQKLSVAPQVSQLPADLTNPFNPPGFDQPSNNGGQDSTRPAAAPTAAQPAPLSDREILEALARRFPTGGTMTHGEKSILTTGARQLQAGQVLTLTDSGREYEIEVVAVAGRSLTLRYRNEQITRTLPGSP